MSRATVESATTAADAAQLDELLWRVLWQPLGLPRTVRSSFAGGGDDALELVAKQDGRIVGGLVAVETATTEIELRHLAIVPDAQRRGLGRALVAELIGIAAAQRCQRIHTTARNTSAAFFGRLGFRPAPGTAPEHPAFRRCGISFVLMERHIAPGGTSRGPLLARSQRD